MPARLSACCLPTFACRFVQALASDLGVPAIYCGAVSVEDYVDKAARLCLDGVRLGLESLGALGRTRLHRLLPPPVHRSHVWRIYVSSIPFERYRAECASGVFVAASTALVLYEGTVLVLLL